MKLRTKITLAILALAALASGGSRAFTSPVKAVNDPRKRIMFQVAAVEEKAGQRNLISETVIEGPPGTDFDLSLQDDRFKLEAKFVTDLVEANTLKVRTRLHTRRLYGYSERKLALYEEDDQDQTMQVNFDEMVVLLPFGQQGGDRLKIEITPMPSNETVNFPNGKRRPLTIKVNRQSRGGLVSIQAHKTPHRFVAEMRLLEDGREIAYGAADYFLGEPREVVLRPTAAAGSEVVTNPLAVNLTIENYLQNNSGGSAEISFDLFRIAQQMKRRDVVGLNWAGAGALGGDINYALGDYYLKNTGRKYELRFNVKLAAGETAE